jgi:hypothetical protein
MDIEPTTTTPPPENGDIPDAPMLEEKRKASDLDRQIEMLRSCECIKESEV